MLGVIEVSFHHEEANMMKLQYAGNLENVQRLYRHYNWDSEASRMMVDVQNAYARAMDEMQPQKFEFEIPKEVFEQAEVMFGKRRRMILNVGLILRFILFRTEKKKKSV